MYVPRIENYMFALLISEIPPEGQLRVTSLSLQCGIKEWGPVDCSSCQAQAELPS